MIVAFLALYLIWGSTYLAIRIADRSIPPFLMLGVRFVVAGAILYGVARLLGSARPRLSHWRSAAVIGVMLPLIGNGGVAYAETRVPSGTAALMIATLPVWIVILDWLKGKKPKPAILMGVVTGLFGVFLLADPFHAGSTGAVPVAGLIALVASPIAWAWGSLYSRDAPLPPSPFLGAAMQMLTGGTSLLVVSVLSGEWAQVGPQTFQLGPWLAVGYLILFGSILAYTSFVWLLGQVSAERVATYAYVNPVVAVFLGLIAGDGLLTPRITVAAAIIVGAAVIITTSKARKEPGMSPLVQAPLAEPSEAP